MTDGVAPLEPDTFKDLIEYHRCRGTRPRGQLQKKWTVKELCAALGIRSETTYPTWKNGTNLPPSVTPLEIVYFGGPASDDEQYISWRHQLRTAFDTAKQEKKQQKLSLRNEPAKPNNLPLLSLGSLFKGRGIQIEAIGLDSSPDPSTPISNVVLIHGLGGIGKTRLAIEHAWRSASRHHAILFIACETVERLNESLAALAGPGIIDLQLRPEADQETRIFAVLTWLRRNPGWLMILDNIDDLAVKRAVIELLPRLQGGSILMTSRLRHFPAAIRSFELLGLSQDDAVDYLLEATARRRVVTAEDEVHARAIATELDGLALGLEQAAAFIAMKAISIERYLALWHQKREVVTRWFDRDLVSYNRDVGLATTWMTSFDSLSPSGRLLMERVALLEPDPVPDALLDVTILVDAAEFDPHDARADLYTFSLASPALLSREMTGFVVHRLVQDFTRRLLSEDRAGDALDEARAWIEGACADRALNAWEWSPDDPLRPHAARIAEECIAFVEKDRAGTIDHLWVVAQCYVWLSLDRAIRVLTETVAKCRAAAGPDLLMGRMMFVLATLAVRHRHQRKEAQGWLLGAAEIFADTNQVEDFQNALTAMRTDRLGPDGTHHEQRYLALLAASDRFGLKQSSLYLGFKLASYEGDTGRFLQKLDNAVAASKQAGLQAEFATELYECFPCKASWEFENVWRAVCGYISTIAETRGANACLFCDQLRSAPQRFGVLSARDAIELLHADSIDMQFPIVGKKTVRMTLEAYRIRIGILASQKKSRSVKWEEIISRLLAVPREVARSLNQHDETEDEHQRDTDIWFWNEGIGFVSDLIPSPGLEDFCQKFWPKTLIKTGISNGLNDGRSTCWRISCLRLAMSTKGSWSRAMPLDGRGRSLSRASTNTSEAWRCFFPATAVMWRK